LGGRPPRRRASPSRDKATVHKFRDLLGKERCEQIQLVSCDMADWITIPIGERCPNAEVCLDPLRVVKLESVSGSASSCS
jgi:transposase